MRKTEKTSSGDGADRPALFSANTAQRYSALRGCGTTSTTRISVVG
jgi:hypothetical protein